VYTPVLQLLLAIKRKGRVGVQDGRNGEACGKKTFRARERGLGGRCAILEGNIQELLERREDVD
jgi:hypothetical protein